jgi:choline kinase
MSRAASPATLHDAPPEPALPEETAIILCAGRGARLGGDQGPKALLSVGGCSILERQTRALRAVGVRQIAVVVGHEPVRVVAACDDLARRLDVGFTFFHNVSWAHTNTAYSMRLATPFMRGRAAYTLNGDVLFPREVLRALRRSGKKIALAIDVKTCGAEEVKVVLDEGDRLLAIDKRLEANHATGELIGVARFDAEGGAAFARAVEDELCDAGINSYYDYALSRLPPAVAATGVRFHGVPMIEIDFPEDLARARDEVAPRIHALDEAE